MPWLATTEVVVAPPPPPPPGVVVAGAVVPGDSSRSLSVSSAGESGAITQVSSAVMNRLGRSTVVKVPASPMTTSPPVAVKLTSAGVIVVIIGPLSGNGVLPVTGSVSISL